MEQVGAKLLDMSIPLDVSALDEVVKCMQNPNSPHIAMANQIMVAFQNHQDAWTRVSQILETSTYQPTKYFGLQVGTLLFHEAVRQASLDGVLLSTRGP
jgi:exportin-1